MQFLPSVHYTRENKRRDRQNGVVTERLDAHDLMDEQNNNADKQTPASATLVDKYLILT